jgi:hypothetical protein
MERERYEPVTRTVLIVRDGKVPTFTLHPTFGKLTVQTNPPGLVFTLDGKAVAAGTSQFEVTAGVHEVLIADPCYAKDGERALVGLGKEVVTAVKARPRKAGLTVRAVDAQQNALKGKLEVDGVATGHIPGTYKVPLCSKAAVSHLSDGRTVTSPLSLTENKVTVLNVVSQDEAPAVAETPPPVDSAPSAPAPVDALTADSIPPPAPAEEPVKHRVHQFFSVDADVVGRYEARWGIWLKGSMAGGIGLDAGLGAMGPFNVPTGFSAWGVSFSTNVIFAIPLVKHFQLAGALGLGVGVVSCADGDGSGGGTPEQQQNHVSCQQYFQNLGRTGSYLTPVYVNARVSAQYFGDPFFAQLGLFYRFGADDSGTSPVNRFGPTAQIGFQFR